MSKEIFEALFALVDNSLALEGETVKVNDLAAFQAKVHKLVETSALSSGKEQMLARYIVRAAALDLGVVPASIHDLYIALGEGKLPPTFTVPAINLRVLPFDAARAVFRAAGEINAAAILFEIARSEIGYTEQRPTEYATNILGAAIAEGYRGPVFIQGDHFQISAKRYNEDAAKELTTVKELTAEAIAAGFYNIDVDTSTLVDLNYATVAEQQALNTQLSAEMTAYIRTLEPAGVTVSVGGEIGEVGKQNSTEEELRAYVDGYITELAKLSPDAIGLSKISIQTGTSHGGVVLPDGTIAQVSVDFDTLLRLSKVSREEYKMGGAVQHGASTLPQDAFGKFVESEACEVHLATNFQNMFYDRCPDDLKSEIYAYLDANHSNERKADQTDDQFYYSTRKRAIGAFKQQIWALPADAKMTIFDAWLAQFQDLFARLAITDTRKAVEQFVTVTKVIPNAADYLAMAGEPVEQEDTSDLAD